MTIRLSTWIVMSVLSALIWSGLILDMLETGWWGVAAWVCIFILIGLWLLDPKNQEIDPHDVVSRS